MIEELEEQDNRPKKKIRRGMACESCSSMKKSCDGNRPCSRCIGGNLECKDKQREHGAKRRKIAKACESCILAKVKCDFARPCARCLKKKLNCGDRTSQTDREKGNELAVVQGFDVNFGCVEDYYEASFNFSRRIVDDSPAKIYFVQYEQTLDKAYADILKMVLENTSPMDLEDFAMHSGKWSIFWRNIARSITHEEAKSFKAQALQTCLSITNSADDLRRQNCSIQVSENITFELKVSQSYVSA